MKKGLIVLIAVIAVVALIAFALIGGYNSLVTDREKVEQAHAEISTQLQRRADLIPNFVATVKGYSDYEQETYTAVTEARSAVGSAKTVSEQAEASDELNRAISVWVNAVTEAYPDLKADAQYRALQDELSGTENRIARARQDYNKAAQSYNIAIKRFPRSLLAGMFGFTEASYFEASAESESVPQVSFD